MDVSPAKLLVGDIFVGHLLSEDGIRTEEGEWSTRGETGEWLTLTTSGPVT